jgi:hypothetical protein
VIGNYWVLLIATHPTIHIMPNSNNRPPEAAGDGDATTTASIVASLVATHAVDDGDAADVINTSTTTAAAAVDSSTDDSAGKKIKGDYKNYNDPHWQEKLNLGFKILEENSDRKISSVATEIGIERTIFYRRWKSYERTKSTLSSQRGPKRRKIEQEGVENNNSSKKINDNNNSENNSSNDNADNNSNNNNYYSNSDDDFDDSTNNSNSGSSDSDNDAIVNNSNSNSNNGTSRNETITKEIKASNHSQQEARDNAKLTLTALTKHVPPDSIVIDGTNGEGVFLSDNKTKRLYKCILVDKYKNQDVDGIKYKGVLSYSSEEFVQYMTERTAMGFIFDPPYKTMNGGHTIVNCTMAKSLSRMSFNSRYGVNYKYINEMITGMFLKGFVVADKVLHDDGVFFLKGMRENRYFDQRQALAELANIYNFHVKDVFTLKNRIATGNDSYLFVLTRKTMRMNTGTTKTVLSLQDMYCSQIERDDYRQLMISRINNRAGEAYLEAADESLRNGRIWANACRNLQEGLNEEQKREAIKDIREEIINSCTSFETKEIEIRQKLTGRIDKSNQWWWEDVQTLALTSQELFLNMKNLAGLFFEQHLHQRGIHIEDPESLQTKKDIELELIGTKIGLVNDKSHISLSNNIQLLRGEEEREGKKQKKQEETKKQAASLNRQAVSLNNWLISCSN